METRGMFLLLFTKSLTFRPPLLFNGERFSTLRFLCRLDFPLEIDIVHLGLTNGLDNEFIIFQLIVLVIDLTPDNLA